MISRQGWWGTEAGGKIQKILLQQQGRVGGHQQPTDDDDDDDDFPIFPPKNIIIFNITKILEMLKFTGTGRVGGVRY